MTTPRSITPVGAVTIEDFFRYLSRHRKQWTPSQIATHAKLPRSVVYRALAGRGVTVKTLQRITDVLGARVLVVIGAGKNRLRP